MAAYRLKIRGKVQGVAYRFSTKMQADLLGITGMVRNEPDGSVYAEIEGEEEVLQQMIEWCLEGPPYAWVEAVDISVTHEKDYRNFEIIR